MARQGSPDESWQDYIYDFYVWTRVGGRGEGAEDTGEMQVPALGTTRMMGAVYESGRDGGIGGEQRGESALGEGVTALLHPASCSAIPISASSPTGLVRPRAG